MPLHRKTRKPTANRESLEKLLQQHPTDAVIPTSLDARDIQKGLAFLSDSYVWRDGRFHPETGFHPRTARFSQKSPNLMQQPQGKRGNIDAEIAEAVRSTIIAPEGMLLLELDYRAQEALLTGFFAGDETYMRMARLDIYSYLVAPRVGIKVDPNMSDAELRLILTDVKKRFKPQRDRMKVVALAWGYGEQTQTMARRLGMSMREAQEYIDAILAVAPKIAKWRENTRMRAHKEKKLTNPWGFCVAPETRILTQDLRWVPAGTLKVGDKLLAFDEEPPAGKRARQFRPSVVTYAEPSVQKRLRVTLSDGSVVVTTPEHPWLARRYEFCRCEWVVSRKLTPGLRVVKGMNVWEEQPSKSAGWLAGFFDGEGSWYRATSGNRDGCSILTAAQLPGEVLDFAVAATTTLGFSCKVSTRAKEGGTSTLIVHGGLPKHLEFLGSVRPIRLLNKVPDRALGEVQRSEDVRVLKVEDIGEGPITLLSTSTKTYFAEGFAMHNSQHFYHVFEPYRDLDGNTKWRLGKEANEPLAFLPQSSGAFILRRALRESEPLWGEDFMVVLTIHDSIVAYVKREKLHFYWQRMKEIMEAPIAELGGLVIATEAKAGPTWSEMAELKEIA